MCYANVSNQTESARTYYYNITCVRRVIIFYTFLFGTHIRCINKYIFIHMYICLLYEYTVVTVIAALHIPRVYECYKFFNRLRSLQLLHEGRVVRACIIIFIHLYETGSIVSISSTKQNIIIC